ncbi:hypothetical protein [Pseudotabrizicola alkalilacus]|nr:hypothetical protein [Pseudotabrizicola alkalilacus]
MRRLFLVVLRALMVLLASISMINADESSAYNLRTAEFKLSADWQVIYSRRDQQFDFVSPDGRYELWARWWFPDEPLLGFDDIIRHETRVLAGQEALFRHIEGGDSRSLELAFLKKDAEGEIFLWQLHSKSTPLVEHEAMFNSLLAGLTIDGLPIQTANGLEAAAPTLRVQGEMFRDPQGAFSLPVPQGWTVQSTTSAGVQQAVAVSPAGDALLLAAAANPDRGMTAAQVLDEYLGILYRDSLIVKSIENEAYPTVDGSTVHAVDTIAKVFPINGVELGYARGRVWICQSTDETGGRAPFLIVTIRAETAAQDIIDSLAQMAAGFSFDVSAGQDTINDAAAAVEAGATQAQAADIVGTAPAAKGLLFDGKAISGLLPIAFASVIFEQNARLTGNEIVFDFPDNQGWAKLGLATPSAVVAMPARDSVMTQRITAIIDADKSTGISLAFSPLAEAGNDPDEVADLKLHLSTAGDGIGKLEVSTQEPAQTVNMSFSWPKGEAVLHVLLRPDQVIDVRDGTGTQLGEVALDADFAGRQWALQTFLQVPTKNRAASLVLKRLSFDTIPFDVAPKVDEIAEGPRSVVIFDGRAFGEIWVPVSRRNGEVAKFLRLSDGALRVGWAADDNGLWTGIATPEAALWLDRFTGVAEARIDVALDGAASKDFEIALQSAYSLPGNLSGNNSYVLRFTGQEDGTYTVLSALRSQEKDGISATGLAVIPDRLALILTPDGVRLEGAGLPESVLAFPEIQEGAGFRIAIHAMASISGDAALVLRGVRTSLHPGEPLGFGKPADGVEPLPMRVFFDGQITQNWEGKSVGNAVFADLAVQNSDGLTLRRRDPVPDWSRIALVGSELVANLDYRIDTTPYEVLVKLDPAAGLGTRIYLHSNAADHEAGAETVVTLRELRSGPQRGGLEVQLHTGHFSYDRWRRVLPADQWRTGWDGSLRLRIGPNWIALGLGDHWLMRGGPRLATEMMMAIVPGGSGNTDGGSVTLHSVSGGWVTPDGMTGVERMRLSETEDFDPDRFLDLLTTETGVSDQ